MSQSSGTGPDTRPGGASPAAVPGRIIQGFATLLGFQLAGEFTTRLLGIPIPGPIIGLLLLFVSLKVRARIDLATPDAVDHTGVAQVATPLLRNLAILFVAPGVGVVQYSDLFVQHGPAVIVVVVAATLATLTVTALVFAATQSFSERLSSASSWRMPTLPITPASVDRASERYLQTRERSR